MKLGNPDWSFGDVSALPPSLINDLARKFMATVSDKKLGAARLKQRGDEAKAAKPRKKRR